MARLLRLHFASIGHRDARLAPLTLDFRHAGGADPTGRAADTVLWLRNGGGKSSILNLFYSVFRPSAREFLGSSAEGRARKLSDYVQARDLAFVVSEWDVAPPDGLELFATAPEHVRVVGQVLAWKGQRRSADLGNLRRLFFSLRADREGALGFDALPIHGLGEPAESFDVFRQWLREVSHEHAAHELVFTENQTTWLAHLEDVGLDPELFRYQLRMNQREGAADEMFRFNRDVDFVRFLIELALTPKTADGIAQNLQAQQDNLRMRPVWLLERRFVSEAIGEVEGLASGVRGLRAAEADLARATNEVAALASGLDARAEVGSEDAARAREAATEAREAARLAGNLRDLRLRWSRGLERLALGYDVTEAEGALQGAQRRLEELREELARGRAAEALVAVRAREAERRELKDALAREREELEPLRLAACARGEVLCRLLDRAVERLDDEAREQRRQAEDGVRAADEASERHTVARERAARASAERDRIDDRIAARDRARESLLGRGAVERREAAADAAERWRAFVEERGQAEASASREREELGAQLEATADRREVVVAARAEAARAAADLGERLEAALAWRDRLSGDPRLRELEEVREPDLEAVGLIDRLRRRARGSRTQLFASRVEGAEDARSLEWLKERGLLPSPVDVRRVVDAITATGQAAHAGPEYLAQNLRPEEVAELLAADPARFGGVIVTTSAALERAASVTVAGLRAPVQVTLLERLVAEAAASSAHVLLPDAALWDRSAADDRRATLTASAAKRAQDERRLADDEAALTELAGELRRFLDAHGAGGIVRLERRADDAKEQVQRADAELKELEERQGRLRGERAAAVDRETRARQERERGSRALEAVERFLAEHEAGLAEARERKDALAVAIRGWLEEAQREREEAERRRSDASSAIERALDRERDARARREERAAVAHRDAASAPEPSVSLEEARVAYQTASRRYEGELSDSRIQWQIEQCEAALAELRAGYEHHARGLDQAQIERLADRADRVAELARVEAAASEQAVSVERCRLALERARATLSELKARRREVDDLPSDRPRPQDAETARREAAALELEAETHGKAAQAGVERARELVGRADDLDRATERCVSGAKLLRGAAEMAGVELPELPPRHVPADPGPLVEELRERFTGAQHRKLAAEDHAKRAAEMVQAIANRSDFAGLDAQYRERMKDPAERLFAAAQDLGERLVVRLAVVEDALAKLDDDRRLIVEELLHLADGVSKLLERAESASRLPAALESWGGRPYLRIGFSFPDLDDERRARLEPLVDRLVSHAQLPSGLELVVLTAIELAGTRGFDVKILKPDTVLRPEPVPLSMMSTFSRGQQLTAAILLYCTLVQLRARTRGRGRGGADAGVLILDNPIGTCSNVALLRLQRTIAERMQVQLVYTTGVDDLDALATLPNKIRLRNTHRDRATGHYHVTAEAGGSLEAVRLVEVPPR